MLVGFTFDSKSPQRSRQDVVGFIHFNFKEYRIVLHKSAVVFQCFVWDELGVAEAHSLAVLGGFQEVLPVRVGNEALRHMRALFWVKALVDQLEGDRETERPFQDVVVLSWQDLEQMENVTCS